MIKRHITLTLIIFTLACGPDEKVSPKYLAQCECNLSTSQVTYQAERSKLKPIKTQPSHHKPRASYSILTDTGTTYIVATSPVNQSFTIYDVTNAQIVKDSKLDYPPIVIGQPTFKSFDSLYFQAPIPGIIFRFDSSGIVREKIEMNIETDWQLTGNPPGLFYDMPQAEFEFVSQNRLLMLVNPFGFWSYTNKNEIKVVSEYDLLTNKVVSNFATLNSSLTEAPIELMDKYTFPHITYNEANIYLSYPYDHRVYKYDYQTKKLIKEACLSSNAIAELVSPLRKNSSTQEEINFQISVPYYGGINFHSDLNLFSRIVYHDKELYTPEGKLSLSSCDRSYSVLLFDSELNLINEINLQNLDLWERALATSNGYVVPGKCSESSGEDYFEYNVKYEFLETNH